MRREEFVEPLPVSRKAAQTRFPLPKPFLRFPADFPGKLGKPSAETHERQELESEAFRTHPFSSFGFSLGEFGEF